MGVPWCGCLSQTSLILLQKWISTHCPHCCFAAKSPLNISSNEWGVSSYWRKRDWTVPLFPVLILIGIEGRDSWSRAGRNRGTHTQISWKKKEGAVGFALYLRPSWDFPSIECGVKGRTHLCSSALGNAPHWVGWGSQDPGRAAADRDLWVHSIQPLCKQGHTEQGAQACVQMAFGDVQGGDPTTSLEQTRHLQPVLKAHCVPFT